MSSIVSFGHLAEAFATFHANGDKLVVHTDVYCVQHHATAFGFSLSALFFLIIAFFAFIGGLLTSDIDDLYVGITILVFGAIFLGIPILANGVECDEAKGGFGGGVESGCEE